MQCHQTIDEIELYYHEGKQVFFLINHFHIIFINIICLIILWFILSTLISNLFLSFIITNLILYHLDLTTNILL